jgi:hypothetical protein
MTSIGFKPTNFPTWATHSLPCQAARVICNGRSLNNASSLATASSALREHRLFIIKKSLSTAETSWRNRAQRSRSCVSCYDSREITSPIVVCDLSQSKPDVATAASLRFNSLRTFRRILPSQALIVQDGPLASLFGFLDHTHTDTL